MSGAIANQFERQGWAWLILILAGIVCLGVVIACDGAEKQPVRPLAAVVAGTTTENATQPVSPTALPKWATETAWVQQDIAHMTVVALSPTVDKDPRPRGT